MEYGEQGNFRYRVTHDNQNSRNTMFSPREVYMGHSV